jgi:hypothetical protein
MEVTLLVNKSSDGALRKLAGWFHKGKPTTRNESPLHEKERMNVRAIKLPEGERHQKPADPGRTHVRCLMTPENTRPPGTHTSSSAGDAGMQGGFVISGLLPSLP